MIRVKDNQRLELKYKSGLFYLILASGNRVVSQKGRLEEIQEQASVAGFALDVWDFLEVYAPTLFPDSKTGIAEYTALLHPEKGVYCIAKGIAPDAETLHKNLDKLKPVTSEILAGVAMLFPDLRDWEEGEWAVTRGIGAA